MQVETPKPTDSSADAVCCVCFEEMELAVKVEESDLESALVDLSVPLPRFWVLRPCKHLLCSHCLPEPVSWFCALCRKQHRPDPEIDNASVDAFEVAFRDAIEIEVEFVTSAIPRQYISSVYNFPAPSSSMPSLSRRFSYLSFPDPPRQTNYFEREPASPPTPPSSAEYVKGSGSTGSTGSSPPEPDGGNIISATSQFLFSQLANPNPATRRLVERAIAGACVQYARANGTVLELRDPDDIRTEGSNPDSRLSSQFGF